jgi:HK97 family phage portal protein
MGLRSWIGNWLYKQVIVDEALLSRPWDAASFTADNFTTLSREGYEHVATVFRAVNLVAKTSAGIQFGVFEENDEGMDELVTGHSFPSNLKRPNPIMGRGSFIKYWVTSMLLGGRAFIWASKSSSGEILELWTLPPDEVVVHWGETYGVINGYTWTTSQGQVLDIPAEDMLYVWFPNPRDILLPISPLQAAAQEVDITNQGLKWTLSLLVNAARPSAYISLPKDSDEILQDKDVNEIKAALREEHTGSSNVGRVMVFKKPGLAMTAYGWTPADMDWVNGLAVSDVRIANVFDVPPELVGAQKTYENFETANRVLYQHAVIPIMELLADELTNWEAIGLEPDQFIGLLLEDIKALQEDQDNLSKRVTNEITIGMITRNEGRAKMKMPPSDDPMADVLTVGKEVTTLGVAELGMGTEDL